MPYYKGKQFRINVYTLILNQWTDCYGNPYPPLNNPSTKQYLDQNLYDILRFANTYSPNDTGNVVPPKCIPGFIPDSEDNEAYFKPITTIRDEPNNRILSTNDPFMFNTSFITPVPIASQNAPQSRKGTKITLSSIYITGSVTKPFIPVPNDTEDITVSRVVNDALSMLSNNQVTFYLIYNDCKNQNEGPPDWRTIFDLNSSNKVTPTTYAPYVRTAQAISGDRVNNQLNGTPLDDSLRTGKTGWNRFTHPELYLNVNSKSKFVILSSMTLDLDSTNSQFNFKMYEKLKVAKSDSNSKKKYPIVTTFSNTGANNLVTNVEGGAVYLVSCCYGVYNTLLKTNDGKESTGTSQALVPGTNIGEGTNNSANNSYLDACKLYPSVSYKMKVNYYDI